MSDDTIDGARGQALWARADRVLPGGGVYLSRSADAAGRGTLPGFIVGAEGCRVTDADGRSYLDFLCANGPNLLGYCHPEIEDAARRQAALMTSASLFPEALVDVVEMLVDRFDGMDWGLVSKNGSEVVALGIRVARQARQRSLVIGFTKAYHGNDPELAFAPAPGVATERTRDVLRVPWNDASALLDLAQECGDRVAAIALNPVDQNAFEPTNSANPDFIAAIEQVRDAYGVLLLLDDVRHGFRMHPLGSHQVLGIKPDLLALGKALGNGYSISALLGTEDLRDAARANLYTSTYMFETPPMRAAIATVEVYDRDDALGTLTAAGTRLREGLLAAAEATGHAISYTGPVAAPMMRFVDDPGADRQRSFARHAADRGALFHPVLNWFLSAAHVDSDIDEAIAIAAEAFRLTSHGA
ncbi:MAG: aminotransferase class III-fold pyridoxal phosphate-dependent enzyme [Actinobacteria bacterium]|nr:aminotransferase class III-fold pyridoxal phosphate-dependent enzyme [Actinomycetota bacterium]